MKINELIRKPLTAFNYEPQPDLMSVREFMRKYGFEQLGKSGNWAKVFDHPKLNYVLKVFRSDDLGYITFLKYALQYTSPFFPKFRGKLVHINNDFAAIRMEKLIEFEEGDFADIPSGKIEFYLDAELGHREFFTGEKAELIEAIENSQPGLVSVLDELAGVGSQINAGGDLGQCNMMWRGDQLVITDPFWKRG